MIRKMECDDYEDIHQLNKELMYTYTLNKTKDNINKLLKNKEEYLYVYVANGKVIGYIHGSSYQLLFSDKLINILGLVISKNYRKDGIGKKLLNYLEVEASRNGYEGVILKTGIERVEAHKFYRKCGYTEEKKQLKFTKKI